VALGIGVKLFLPTPIAKDLPPQTIQIKPGVSFSWMCDQLVDRGLVRDRWALILLARAVGLERRLPAGEVTLKPGMSVWQIVWKLRHSEASTINVMVPEGLQARQIAFLLQSKGVVDSAAFMDAVSDSRLIHKLGFEVPDLEGFLFPDTYNFYFFMDGDAVVQRMVDRFSEVWTDSLTARAAEIGWTVRQALTMASIIQGEVMIPSEAPTVSSVYHNRLKKGMLLQADPTIQYIIPDGPRRLLKDDLQIDSPYNTYLHRGLPPGPICNPGITAIMAALYPADTNYLYFVAKGDGSHAFNETEEGHWRDKWEFQKVRREVARNNNH
jgi:UPF0755 protein